MYSFKNDYSEGAHPRILELFQETNQVQQDGYGKDQYSLQAAALIKEKLGSDQVDIHFIPGGTHSNLIAISAFLRPHEAAIAADTGHILVHETGAIEATGHKIISIASEDGKLTPAAIKKALDEHTDEHMVKPRLVYISNSTELGTVYSCVEIEALSKFCRNNGLYFFMDGARLGSALCSEGNDLALTDLSRLLDAFYIGGTKNGALLGETLVICRDRLKDDFRYHMKQKGALLAKGRIIGIQFLALFQDDLYIKLAHHANKMAMILKEGLISEGFGFLTESPSNQQFPVLPDALIFRLREEYGFNSIAKTDVDHTVIRLVTSWATPEDAVRKFVADLHRLNHQD